MSATRSADWTFETVRRLRQLWAEGLSTAEIGRQLNISKNAVIGKAHRLELPRRSSPIGRGAVNAPRRPSRPACPRPTRLMPPTPIPPPVPDSTFREPPPAPIAVPRGKTPCCWPIGEPSHAAFRFCGADSMPGKPYCPDHCGLAYRKPRQSLEQRLLPPRADATIRSGRGGMG